MPRNFEMNDALRSGNDKDTGFIWRVNGVGLITATDEIIGAGSSVEYPTTAVEFFVASTNAGDTLAGAGAQRVLVQYLDGNFDQASIEVDMDGQTPVSIGLATRIQLIEVIQDGVTADFDGTNGAPIGTIHAGRGVFTLGIPALPFMNIPPGKGESKTSLFTVPRGYTAILESATLSSFKNDEFTFTNWLREEGGSWREGGSVINSESGIHIANIFSSFAPALTDIQIRAQASSSSAIVNSIVDLKILKA